MTSAIPVIPRQLQAAPGAAAAPSAWMQMLPMVAIFAIFYFLLIAPQRKRQKQHQQLLSNLKRGDEVVLSSGIHGSIAAVDDQVVHLKVADQVKIKVEKSSVASLVSSPDSPKE